MTSTCYESKTTLSLIRHVKDAYVSFNVKSTGADHNQKDMRLELRCAKCVAPHDCLYTILNYTQSQDLRKQRINEGIYDIIRYISYDLLYMIICHLDYFF